MSQEQCPGCADDIVVMFGPVVSGCDASSGICPECSAIVDIDARGLAGHEVSRVAPVAA